MRIYTIFSAFCAATLTVASPQTAQVYIQPTTSTGSPEPLADISYDVSTLSSEVTNYGAPDLDTSPSTVRIGLYDAKTSKWLSGTTLASVENFAKGYSPNIILSVSSQGDVLSASLKGVRIDAGVTRDFGPKSVIVLETKSRGPELNKPVVLSAEGKKVEEVEKTLLQKYWWVIGIVAFLMLSGGGDK